MTGKQRRSRRIAMTADGLSQFLREQRTCRVASVSANGPHVSPLWFVWIDDALWLHSVVRSQRWTDLERDQRVAVVVDCGEAYEQLRGVELRGVVQVVGEVPRTGAPLTELVDVEAAWVEKYGPGTAMEHDGRHAWLRLAPGKITSWDFRKLDRATPSPPPHG